MLAPSSGRQGFYNPSSTSSSDSSSMMVAMARPSSGRQDFNSTLPQPAWQPSHLANSGNGGGSASSTSSSDSSSMMFAMARPSSGRQDFNSTLPQPPAWQPPNLANSGNGGGSASAAGRVRHESITCDVCGVSPIVGVRYRCTVCPDYDVCEICVDYAPPTSLSGVAPNGHDRDNHFYLRIRQSTPQVHDTVAASALLKSRVWFSMLSRTSFVSCF